MIASSWADNYIVVILRVIYNSRNKNFPADEKASILRLQPSGFVYFNNIYLKKKWNFYLKFKQGDFVTTLSLSSCQK